MSCPDGFHSLDKVGNDQRLVSPLPKSGLRDGIGRRRSVMPNFNVVTMRVAVLLRTATAVVKALKHAGAIMRFGVEAT